ncbi:SMEK domain-containing protein [Gimesia sp.]|uniref:SMEK domain-containing protein n=1 Tax=Gimesia sp. TaxID=2024833 RepID=UPI0032EB117A
MITRGYLIGEIVDQLSTIAQQVEIRGKLNLLDINTHLESFFKTILNHVLNLNLTNLNQDVSNVPALDLQDSSSGTAIQITSLKSSDKVNDAVQKALELETPPQKLIVFIIGHKQKTYTLDETTEQADFFSRDNIWDINTLAKKLIDLELDTLHTIYNYIVRECTKVLIELEIPNTDGEYPTSLINLIEVIPRPKISDFSFLFQYLEENNFDPPCSREEVITIMTEYSECLSKLPRITREFYSILMERREQGSFEDSLRVNLNRINRYCENTPIIVREELIMLQEYDLIRINIPDYEEAAYESPYIYIDEQKYSTLSYIVDFIEAGNLSFQRAIVFLDFSDFGVELPEVSS